MTKPRNTVRVMATGMLSPSADIADVLAWPLPVSLEWMPAGERQIQCTVNGKPKRVNVRCTADDVTKLDAQLQEQLKRAAEGKASRPFIDFDHEGKEAAAIPSRFFWDDGIRLEVAWTEAGAESLRGRTYSYFSPEFLLSEDGAIAGLPDVGPIGALVNTPAFQDIERLAASATSGGETNTMNELMKALIAAGIALADGATDAQASAAFASAWAAVTAERDELKAKLATAEAALTDTTAKLTASQTEAQASRQAKAEAIVAAAVASGKIKDDPALRGRWVTALLSDEPGTVTMINGLEPVKVQAGHTNTQLPGRVQATGKDLLAQFNAMPEGKEKDEFQRANAAALLKAARS